MQTDKQCLKDENQSKIRMDEEIEEFINEYRTFLVNNNMDVAKSIISNRWFVYRYEETYGYYDFFIEFSTVSQLVDIILDEMEFQLYFAIGKEVELKHEDLELAEMISGYYKNKKTKTELAMLLDRMLNSELGKNSEFFEMLNKLCKTQEAYESV